MIAESLAALLPSSWASTSFDALNPRDPAIARILGLGSNVKSKVRVDPDTVLGIPAVMRGVNILSNAMMKCRPLIYKRIPNGSEDDKERDKAHSSWKFVTKRANRFLSAGDFRKTLTSWGIYRGNGLGWIERDVAGRIIQGIPLPPDRSGMLIVRDGRSLDGSEDPRPGDEIMYYTQVGGEIRRLAAEDVIHIRGFSANGYWGVDIIDVLCETFGLSIAARDYSATFFGQGATPSGIVFAPTGLSAKGQEDFTERVRKAGEGLGRSHRLMILEETAKYEQISVDPEKAQLLATRQFSLIDVANVLGIQAHKLGDTSRMAYNSLEQSNQEHLDDDLDPWLQIWENELTEKCLTEDEKDDDTHFVEFNRKSLVRVNLQARTSRHQFERQNGLATANDILRQENSRPIGAVGDTYMVPANMTVLTSDGLPIIRGQAAPEPQPRPEREEDPEQSDRAAYHEVAIHEVERLAKRATGEAVRQSKQGPAAFLSFLDQLPQWTHQPARIAPLLEASAAYIHGRLNKFTEAPYAAGELQANVLAATDDIITHTVRLAREHLEAPR